MQQQPEHLLQSAWNAYNGGALDDALGQALRAAKTDENPRYGLYLACRCLIETGRLDDLLALLEQVHRPGLHAASVFLSVGNAYMLEGRYEILRMLHDKLPETHMAGFLALYLAGCADSGDGDRRACLEKMKRFRERCGHFKTMVPFVEDDALNVVYRQSNSVATPAEVAARLADPPMAIPAAHGFEWKQKTDRGGSPAGIVYFACADSVYLSRFGPDLMHSFDRHGRPVRLHLDVMQPQESVLNALIEKAAALPNVTLDLSVSQTRNSQPSLYACGRFFLLPELLSHYDLPVVVVDADSEVTALIHRFAEISLDFDIGFFPSGKITPASFVDCAIFVACPTPGAARYLEVFRKYADPLLERPSRLAWLTDQSTIFSLDAYFADTGLSGDDVPVRIVDMRSIAGVDFLYDIVPQKVTENEKNAIKSENAMGRPL